MEYSMAFEMFTSLISRKSRRREEVRGKKALLVSISNKKKRKIVTFRPVREENAMKWEEKEEKITRDKA